MLSSVPSVAVKQISIPFVDLGLINQCIKLPEFLYCTVPEYFTLTGPLFSLPPPTQTVQKLSL